MINNLLATVVGYQLLWMASNLTSTVDGHQFNLQATCDFRLKVNPLYNPLKGTIDIILSLILYLRPILANWQPANAVL